MISFRIHLNRSQASSPWSHYDRSHELDTATRPGLLARLGEDRKLKRLQGEYAAYFAERSWVPSAPVRVKLLHSLDTRDHLRSQPDEYELELFGADPDDASSGKTGLAARLANLAAAAAVVFTPGQAAVAALGPDSATPQGPHVTLAPHQGGASSTDLGPPVTRLKSHVLRSEDAHSAASGEHARPVRVASFHSNTAASHTNTAQSHTNTWGNHANIQTTHSNVWQNHSNTAASGTTPHTNMVPGDFVF
jgi:hypothetical protein